MAPMIVSIIVYPGLDMLLALRLYAMQVTQLMGGRGYSMTVVTDKYNMEWASLQIKT